MIVFFVWLFLAALGAAGVGLALTILAIKARP